MRSYGKDVQGGALAKLAALVGLAAVLTFGLSGVAGAQPADSGTGAGYPGTIQTAENTTNSQTVTVSVGGSVPVEACQFEPSSSTSMGVSDGAGCDGFVVYGHDPHLSIDNGPLISAVFGLNPNVVVVTGPNTLGGTQTDFVNVVLVQSGSTSQNLAFTGADIMATVVGGLALIALGFLVLTIVRRRAAASSRS